VESEPGMGTRFFSFFGFEEEVLDSVLWLEDERCDVIEVIFERSGAERSVERRSEEDEVVGLVCLDIDRVWFG
jgi:hypothetical protein